MSKSRTVRTALAAALALAVLPAAAHDAFFQLVLYPIAACANLNELHVAAGRNRLYAVQGRSDTNREAERVRQAFDADAALVERYHALAGALAPSTPVRRFTRSIARARRRRSGRRRTRRARRPRRSWICRPGSLPASRGDARNTKRLDCGRWHRHLRHARLALPRQQ